MTDQLTPDRIKAFLDDLARISLRHGVKVDVWPGGVSVDPIDEVFAGYQSWGIQRELQPASVDDLGESGGGVIHSIDLTQLSNHERLAIMGGQW